VCVYVCVYVCQRERERGREKEREGECSRICTCMVSLCLGCAYFVFLLYHYCVTVSPCARVLAFSHFYSLSLSLSFLSDCADHPHDPSQRPHTLYSPPPRAACSLLQDSSTSRVRYCSFLGRTHCCQVLLPGSLTQHLAQATKISQLAAFSPLPRPLQDTLTRVSRSSPHSVGALAALTSFAAVPARLVLYTSVLLVLTSLTNTAANTKNTSLLTLSIVLRQRAEVSTNTKNSGMYGIPRIVVSMRRVLCALRDDFQEARMKHAYMTLY